MTKRIGKKIAIWLPETILDEIDAARDWRTRSEYIRNLLAEKMTSPPTDTPKKRVNAKSEAFADQMRQYYAWCGQDYTPAGYTLKEYAATLVENGQYLVSLDAWEKQGFTPD